MSNLIAYKGKQSIKNKYLKRVEEHYKADEIIQGVYWENGKGCAVGCTIEGNQHERYETELGIPRELAYLEDGLFEALTNGDAKEFPVRFLKAIKPGADLSLVTAKFMVWQFEDKKYGLKNIKEVKDDKEVYGFCKEVVALYKRKIAGDTPTEDEFYQLYLKIDRARARAGAWARAWARAGAGARARAGAGAGA
jgi:hypothetical protein